MTVGLTSRWTAVVPLKAAGARKSRLAMRLSEVERDALAVRMAEHVIRMLREGGVDDVRVISPLPVALEAAAWEADHPNGLNASLSSFRDGFGGGPLVVIHADLPLLTAENVYQLLADAQDVGATIAPDRHDTGTNALAVADGRPLRFQFGLGSFARHHQESARPWGVVRRRGLMIDIDTPDDLDLWAREIGPLKPIDSL